MARIEISLEEYNGLKNKIKTLENTLGDVSKEAAIYKEKLGKIEGLVIDLEEETLINRIFSWKSIITPLKNLFSNGGTK